ncbi:MAG: hypothetical protein IJ600_05670 [Lachnospiraceae bacterium]|nr:hypothetical protein [Lachnospiraceae bacterium]
MIKTTKKKNGRKKTVRKIVLTAMAVVTLMSTLTAAAAGAHDGRLTDRVAHSDLKFSEYEYARMDKADFDAIIEGLDELVQDEANADAVLDVIIGMEDYYNELSRCYSIAHIHSDLVADDKYWDDEVMFWDELGTDVGDGIMMAYKTIAVSPCADVLHERVDDEEEWQDILDYEEMTQEQKDLVAKETELSLQYDILYNKEYSTKLNGRIYTEAELDEAYADGTVDRDQYYAGTADLLKQANEERGQLYLDLVKIRTELARSHGYDNYADYAYEKIYDRDYGTAELKAYRDAVKNYLVPLQDELIYELYGTHYDEVQNMFEKEMGEEECLETLREYLPKISNDLIPALDYMEEHELYDISIDSAKAPGGYTCSICGYNAPFLYNCADGSIMDMETLIHEYGHYNQMYHMTEDSWYYDKTDLDIAEIHSQGLELLFMDYAGDIYGEFSEAVKLYTIFNLTYAAVEGVKEDAFQYAVYSDADNMTLDKLNQLYFQYCTEYTGRYGSMFSDSISLANQGYLPSGVAYEWVQIPHTFQSPMYYISYSTSVAAVFELFDVILDDRDEGIETYLALVDAEFQEGFQDTLDKVGLNNPIAEPRFDLYADDIRYYVGLADERTVVNNYEAHQPTTYWGEAAGGSETAQPADGDEHEEVIPGEDAVEDGEETEDTEDTAQSENEAKDRRAAAGVLAVVLFSAAGIGVVVLIVILAKNSRKGRAGQINTNGQGNPATGRMPVRQSAYMQQNPYVQQAGQTNPYAQQGSQINPYAQQGGQINPYTQSSQPLPGSQQGAFGQPLPGSQQGAFGQPLPGSQQGAFGQPLSGSQQGAFGQPLPGSHQNSFGQPQPMNRQNGSGQAQPGGGQNAFGQVQQPINPYAQQSAASINPYAQNVQINPYAQQPISPYAQKTAPNPYLQNLQAMQQAQADVSMTAGQSGTADPAAESTAGAVSTPVMGNAAGAASAPTGYTVQPVAAADPYSEEARKAVITAENERMQALRQDPKAYGAYLREMAQRIPQEEKEKILELIRADDKLQAIKLCREQSGAGLADAKTMVDEYLKYL